MRIRSVATATLLLLPALCLAQEQSNKPSFEAVSIRAWDYRMANGSVVGMMPGGPGTPDPERFRSNGATLWDVLCLAFNVSDYQITGPGWAKTAQYQINASVRPGATRDEFRLMLQTMLAERFNLEWHRGSKELRV